ncbi:hypothetical protein FB45DRAFT_933721 [Roridomyces roridus]|uniref:Uncharacterized protein n=1 Tax=Roridomyces roridus TaxID=1738132 RepID=A0AAD7BCY7_9AGAR|nr:hypothetical protein FB45DRAFT_933721 [Roridomyces roridus]
MSPKVRAGTRRASDVGVWLDETAFAMQNEEDEYMQFSLNLGDDTDSTPVSACATPPRLRLDVGALQRKRKNQSLAGQCATCLQHVASKDLVAGGLCPNCAAFSPVSTITHSSALFSVTSGDSDEDKTPVPSQTAAPSPTSAPGPSSLVQSHPSQRMTELQAHRHALAQLTSLNGALSSLTRLLFLFLVVGVLASRGDWTPEA